ncbi:cob(I)yrinic acid a,c-diamide adenosyltransferase [Xanthomonadaceae bacterium JHOS43]|nr:cob(I)yrinic acid a,c-diamide adenosyltransferase [Xanthomonadaceae bacterium JHOS43]MCX7563525.1 cob(I)yrinic acid a,c-diamide adenosyltransferase [Xanthomonadaceae bacterium XH05]
MGNRLSKIYTRTGDAGSTGLGDGTRVPKDGARIGVLGALDETNSQIGVLLAQGLPGDVLEELVSIQHALFDLGGELCLPGHAAIEESDVAWLEYRLDAHNAELPPLKEFILPGGNAAAAHCHVARCVCRRAECALVALSRQESVRPQALAFINRLSDYLFVLARVLARADGGSETLWQHGKRAR